MVIRLTKNYKKPNGQVIEKGRIISVATGHPYKDFEIVIKEGSLYSPKNALEAEKLEGQEAKEKDSAKTETNKNNK